MRYYNFSIKDIAWVCKARQKEKRDAIIAIAGARGNGKSTLAFKIMKQLGFKPNKDIIYDLDSLRKSLNEWDKAIMVDEAIYVSYKRDWQGKGQKELIKQFNAYRDHRNIVILCIPNFWDLDKALREFVFMRIDVLNRGKAAVHLPIEASYTNDSWDLSNNEKTERRQLARNRTKKHYKFSTFNGYVKFKALSEKDEERYQKIKNKKRNELYEGDDPKESKKKNEPDHYQILYDMKKEYGKITPEAIQVVARLRGVKPRTVLSRVSDMKALTPEP